MNTRHTFKLAIAALALSVGGFASTDAQARPSYVSGIPSTASNSCTTCHGGQGGPRNDFGMDVESNLNGGPDWSAVFSLDSDGDGYTNGQELGDPAGTWTPGDAATFVSNPGVNSESPCGNGQIDQKVSGSEACDGAALDGKTCADFGGTAQEALSCTSSCEFDTSACGGVNPPDDMGPDMVDEMPDVSGEDETPDVSAEDETSDTSSEDASPDSSPIADVTPDDSTVDSTPSTDMSTTTPSTEEEDDGGCAQASTGGPAPTGVLVVVLGMLGMFGLRRRRA